MKKTLSIYSWGKATYLLADCYGYREKATYLTYNEDLLLYEYWMTKSANRGNLEACIELACYYRGGKLTICEGEVMSSPENYSKAFYWAMIVCEQKDDYGCQKLIANSYRLGRGVERNFSEAINWYNKAIKFRSYFHTETDYSLYVPLGECYFLRKNDGDAEKAFENISVAYKNDVSDSGLYIAYFYFYGIGTKENKQLAGNLFEKYLNYGHSYSEIRLKEYFRSLHSFEKVFNFPSVQKEIYYAIGCCLFFGYGTTIDYFIGEEYLTAAVLEEIIEEAVKEGDYESEYIINKYLSDNNIYYLKENNVGSIELLKKYHGKITMEVSKILSKHNLEKHFYNKDKWYNFLIKYCTKASLDISLPAKLTKKKDFIIAVSDCLDKEYAVDIYNII